MNKIKSNRYKLEYDIRRLYVPLLIILISIFVGVSFSSYSANYQTTNDAYIEGRIIQIASRVSGPIIHLNAMENQEVKKGDLLLEIDSKSYENRLREAENKLKLAKIKYNTVKKQNKENNFSLFQPYKDKQPTDPKYGFQQHDKNYIKMNGTDTLSKQDSEKNKQNSDSATIPNVNEQTINGEAEAESEFDNISPEELLAEIKRLESQVSEAKLALSYTKVYAPQDGTISTVNIHEGDYVDMSEQLLSIVPKRLWINATFKINQTADIQIGQPVKIKIPNYPRRTFKGVVDYIQYPREVNTSFNTNDSNIYLSNQKVNIRIAFIEDYSEYNLTPGMPVIPSVKIK